jgi:hypothetical protein
LKKLLLAALLGFTLMTWVSMPLLAQTEIVIHFSGFALEEGGFDWSQPGDELHIITQVTSITGPPGLPYFPDDYEYTLVVTGLISNGEIDEGGYSNIVYNLGLMEIYEDPSFNADWNDVPTIPDPPDSFFDGTLWLEGGFYQFSMVLFRDFAMGNFDGEMTLDGGAAIDAFEEQAYIFGGNLIPPHNPGIPDGYDMSIDGEVWGNSTPTASSSLSQIKALY